MADPRLQPFKNMKQFLRHMTSPAPVAYLKGKSFWTHYLPSKFRRHRFNIQVQKSPVWIGINYKTRFCWKELCDKKKIHNWILTIFHELLLFANT